MTVETLPQTSATIPTAAVDARAKPHVHIDALDGIRGIAILLVIVHHLAQSLQVEFSYKNPVFFEWTRPLFAAARLGWSGVDLFLVLSGFLITGILFDAKEKPRFYVNFYARRTLRIFPLYYLALTAIFLLKFAWPTADFYPRENQAWLWLYLTNVIMTLKGGGGFGILEHFWSLAVEEQFYLIWPFIVHRFNRETLMKIAGAAVVIALVLRIVLIATHTYEIGAYVLMPARMDALAAGAFVALAARGPGGIERLAQPAKIVAGAAAAACLALLVWRRSVKHDDPILATLGVSLFAFLFASILVLAVARTPVTRVVSHGVLRWFGKYSYGMYVWHPILFFILMHTESARALRGGEDFVRMVLSVALSLAATGLVVALSWTLIEKQFLKLKRLYQ